MEGVHLLRGDLRPLRCAASSARRLRPRGSRRACRAWSKPRSRRSTGTRREHRARRAARAPRSAIVTPGSPPESRAEVQRGLAWWRRRATAQADARRPGARRLARRLPGGARPRHPAGIRRPGDRRDPDDARRLRLRAGDPAPRPRCDRGEARRRSSACPTSPPCTSPSTGRARHLLRPEPDHGRRPEPAGPSRTDRLLRVLAGETTGEVPADPDRLTVDLALAGRASGRLVGGCLIDFIYTIGTPWEIDLTDSIFFLEEVGIAPIRLDRALLYLDQIGKLRGVRGIVVGELAGLRVARIHLLAALEDAGGGPRRPAGTPWRADPLRPAARPRGDASPPCRSASRRPWTPTR